MKLIPLTRGYEAMVDDDDYEKVNRRSWFLQPSTCIYAATRMNGVKYLHNFIMPPPIGFTVDHIDRNGLNCQRNNMRFATRSQQAANRLFKKNNYHGVFRQDNRWIVKIGYKGKRHYGGSFIDEVEAAKAYDVLAKKYHGEFAMLNFSGDQYE